MEDRGAWRAIAHEFAKSRVLLRDWATTTAVPYFPCKEPPSASWCAIPGPQGTSCQDIPVAASRMDWGLWPRPGLSEHTFSWPSREVMAKQGTPAQSSDPIRPIPESLSDQKEDILFFVLLGLELWTLSRSHWKKSCPTQEDTEQRDGKKLSPHDITRSLDQITPETGWFLF